VEADAGWPRKDNTKHGLERPDGGCRSGSALDRGVRPRRAATNGGICLQAPDSPASHPLLTRGAPSTADGCWCIRGARRPVAGAVPGCRCNGRAARRGALCRALVSARAWPNLRPLFPHARPSSEQRETSTPCRNFAGHCRDHRPCPVMAVEVLRPIPRTPSDVSAADAALSLRAPPKHANRAAPPALEVLRGARFWVCIEGAASCTVGCSARPNVRAKPTGGGRRRLAAEGQFSLWPGAARRCLP
jgi:hypothetical protein